MTRRLIALENIKLAVADNNEKLAMRIYTENRIGYVAFKKAWDAGEVLKQKLNGRKATSVSLAELNQL